MRALRARATVGDADSTGEVSPQSNAIRSFVCTRAHRRRGHTRATRKGQGGRAHRGAAMATPMVEDDANAARARATPEPTTDTHRDTRTNIRNRQRFETRVTDAVWSVRARVLSRARVTSRGVTAFQQPCAIAACQVVAARRAAAHRRGLRYRFP